LLSFFPSSFEKIIPKVTAKKGKGNEIFIHKNQIFMLFTGRLTADAEVKELKNDKQVTNFTIALNHSFKTRAGEKKEKTAFIDCSYWVNPPSPFT
jgi:hypothetical protein